MQRNWLLIASFIAAWWAHCTMAFSETIPGTFLRRYGEASRLGRGFLSCVPSAAGGVHGQHSHVPGWLVPGFGRTDYSSAQAAALRRGGEGVFATLLGNAGGGKIVPVIAIPGGGIYFWWQVMLPFRDPSPAKDILRTPWPDRTPRIPDFIIQNTLLNLPSVLCRLGRSSPSRGTTSCKMRNSWVPLQGPSVLAWRHQMSTWTLPSKAQQGEDAHTCAIIMCEGAAAAILDRPVPFAPGSPRSTRCGNGRKVSWAFGGESSANGWTSSFLRTQRKCMISLQPSKPVDDCVWSCTPRMPLDLCA